MHRGGRKDNKQHHPIVNKITTLRDELKSATDDPAKKEQIDLACKGLYRCEKDHHDEDGRVKCLTPILKRVEAFDKSAPKKKGGRRSKSRSKPRSRSRSRSKK
jgi:hypothetical protein